MHFINPFKGLRPTEEKASSVSIPSTDHLSEEVNIIHNKNNLKSKNRKILMDAMLLTIAGISAAMKNTG